MQTRNGFWFVSLIIAHIYVSLPMNRLTPTLLEGSRSSPASLRLHRQSLRPSALSIEKKVLGLKDFVPGPHSSSSSPRGSTSPIKLLRAPTPIITEADQGFKKFGLSKSFKRSVAAAYNNAPGHRLFVFDYDGTLCGFVQDPEAAIPSAELLEELEFLSRQPDTDVWIVSGRDQGFLNKHLGHIPYLGFQAEYGAATKYPRQPIWEAIPFDKGLLEPISRVIQKKVKSVPTSHEETSKQFGTAYHYRKPFEDQVAPYNDLLNKVKAMNRDDSPNAEIKKIIQERNLPFVDGPTDVVKDVQSGDLSGMKHVTQTGSGKKIESEEQLKQAIENIGEKYEHDAQELKKELEEVIADKGLPLVTIFGNKVVEVKFDALDKDKRKAIEKVYRVTPDPTFALVAGDDTADEAMFAVAHEKAGILWPNLSTGKSQSPSAVVTIRVSSHERVQTEARHTVQDSEALIALLREIRESQGKGWEHVATAIRQNRLSKTSEHSAGRSTALGHGVSRFGSIPEHREVSSITYR